MKSSSYESILVDLIPLHERRDYAVKGLDAVEQNALKFVEKGGHLPMGLELQLRKRFKKYDNEKEHISSNLELKETLSNRVNIHAKNILTREAVIKRCPKKNLTDDRPVSEQQWCLFDSKGEKLLGRHPSKEKALNQEKAIQIHKHMATSEKVVWENLGHVDIAIVNLPDDVLNVTAELNVISDSKKIRDLLVANNLPERSTYYSFALGTDLSVPTNPYKQKSSDTKFAIQAVRTAIRAIFKHIEQTKPDQFTFTADNSESSRVSLYDSLKAKFETMGYSLLTDKAIKDSSEYIWHYFRKT